MFYHDRSRWLRQPSGRLEIDHNHPLAPWLVFAAVPGMVRNELRAGDYLRNINTTNTLFKAFPHLIPGSGGGTVSNWDPSTETSGNFEAWIDPSDSAQVTLNASSRITQITDKSVDGTNHAVIDDTATSTGAPAIGQMSNGLDAMDFSATNTEEYLVHDSVTADTRGISYDQTISIAWQHKTGTFNGELVLYSMHNDTGGNVLRIHLNDDATNNPNKLSYTIGNTRHYVPNWTFNDTDIHVVTFRLTDQTSLEVRVDDETAYTTITSTPPRLSLDSAWRATIGMEWDTDTPSDFFSNGYIGEVVYWKIATTRDVHSYMRSRWAPPSSAPRSLDGAGGLVTDVLSNASGGLWLPYNNKIEQITNQMTVLFGAEVDAWADNGALFSIPRAAGLWTDFDFAVGRVGTENTINLRFRYNDATASGALTRMGWNWNPVPNGDHEGFNTVGLTWKNGGTAAAFANNKALTAATADPAQSADWTLASAKDHFALMNRSNGDPGYGVDGQLEWLFLFNKAVDSQVLKELHRAPYQIMKPNRALRVYQSLESSVQTVTPAGHGVSVGFGTVTITGEDGTSVPFVQRFNHPDRIRVGGDTAEYRMFQNFSFARAGTVYDLNDKNRVRAFGPNSPVWNTDGMRHEPAATNLIPNSEGTGANASTDTLPNGWSFEKPGTFPALDVSAVGTDGAPYVEFTFDEINNEVERSVDIYFNEINGTAASQGETYTGSVFVEAMGRMSHFPRLQIADFDSVGTEIGSSISGMGGANFLHVGSVARFAVTRTLSANTSSVVLRLRFTIPSGAHFRAKFRVYLPQLEAGSVVTSAIRTSGSTASRSASSLVANINFGTYTSITEEWINERNAEVVQDLHSSPAVPDEGWTIAPKAGYRLRRFALDTDIAETFYRTSNPGADIPARGTGQSIIIQPGVYNVGNIDINAENVTVIGMVSTILEGASEATGWTFDGTYWTKSGIDTSWPNAPESAWVNLPYSAGRLDLFVNGAYVPRKTDRSELVAGEWTVESGTAYYLPGTDLSLAEVKLTNVQGPLFTAKALNNCKFYGLRAFRYSENGRKGGFVDFQSSTDVLGSGNVIEDCVLHQHHLTAIGLGNDTTIRRTYITNHGGVGIYAGRNDIARSDLLIEDCYIAKGGQLTIDRDEDAGGILLQRLTGAIIRDTELKGHKGRGVWYDWRVHDTLLENCYIHENENVGLDIKDSGRASGTQWHEVSYCNFRRNAKEQVAAGAGKSTLASDVLARGSQYVHVHDSRLFSEWGPAWMFTGNLNSPFDEDFPKFVDNVVVMLDGDQYNGLKAANADGGTTTYTNWYNNLEVDRNEYHAAENNDVRWEWVTSAGASTQYIYDGLATSLPDNGEANSTFTISATPGDAEVFGFLLNQQTIVPSGLGVAVNFGTTKILEVPQTVTPAGLAVQVAMGEALISTDDFLIANGIGIQVAFGTPTVDLGGAQTAAEPFEVGVDFGTTVTIVEQFLEPTSLEVTITFGETTVSAPQPPNFQTSYFDVNPHRGLE